MIANSKHVNDLAAIIREVQRNKGTRRMGAADLAREILSCPASQWLLGNPPAALAQPEGEGQGERIISIAKAVQEHAFGWEPDARLIGNVCAEDVADLCSAILARCGRPTAPPAPFQHQVIISATKKAARRPQAGEVEA